MKTDKIISSLHDGLGHAEDAEKCYTVAFGLVQQAVISGDVEPDDFGQYLLDMVCGATHATYISPITGDVVKNKKNTPVRELPTNKQTLQKYFSGLSKCSQDQVIKSSGWAQIMSAQGRKSLTDVPAPKAGKPAKKEAGSNGKPINIPTDHPMQSRIDKIISLYERDGDDFVEALDALLTKCEVIES